MLLWSLAGILVFFIFQISADRAKEYFFDVIVRWIISSALFTIAYLGMKQMAGGFDPSGHFAGNLVAQANHASYYLFTKKYGSDGYVDLDKPASKKQSNWVEVLAFISFASFQAHACYSLFFTGFIFHTIVESFTGWIVGLLIAALTYETSALNSLLLGCY